MKKIWFFVEGDSEENFIINLIRFKYAGTVLLSRDLTDFVLKDLSQFNSHLAYCENCHSVDKIPFKIQERSYLIEKSGSSNIIVVCDLEKFPCYLERKKIIENTVREKINLNHMHYAFFKPMIESGYWECDTIIEKIITMNFREKFTKLPPNPLVLENNNHPLESLKKSFKKYDLKYRESDFSEKFFPRVDFDTCQNLTLKRLISKLDSI
jgi:hypothetical protein